MRGTESFSRAWKNVLASLIEDFIKFGLQWSLTQAKQVAESLAGVNADLTAHLAANAAKTASDASAAGAGALAWLGSAVKAIEASAAEAFAGVFGFLAPVLGPAAAGPAAAAGATVAAAAGAVASADIGMWQVPQDMMTLVHHNELIMPAAQSEAFRNLLAGDAPAGGGGGNVSVSPQMRLTIQANDSAGVAQWARNNASELAKAFHEASRHGALLGLRRFAPA